jgi:hypothetical protein
MTKVETTGATASTETIVAPTVAPAAPKAPSKKSLALAIFSAKMVERTQGLFASNKEFRASVLRAIETDLGVSTASAATMYNAAKVEAEAADATVGLGRDPKVVKVKVEGAGKRGRPAGSKNKAAVVTDAVAEVATTEAAVEAAPAAEAVAA